MQRTTNQAIMPATGDTKDTRQGPTAAADTCTALVAESAEPSGWDVNLDDATL
jgi:hypothetical protein